jgi:2-hydroxy-6-oxo-6-(2'-carboxyphenyl)-hexa-2,4-dienoate hydrolase
MPVVDQLDETKLKFIDVHGLRTRYYDEGDGEPLVLLHGGDYGFVDSLDTWSRNLHLLAKDFRVLALDKSGQGYTDPPLEDADYTQDYTLQHALGWLDALGITSAHLAGHSRGGLLAAQMAYARPGLARSLVIINSATLAPDPEDPALRSSVFYASVGVHDHQGVWTREDMLVEPVANSYSQDHITDEYIDRYLVMSRLDSFMEAESKMRDGLENEVFMPSLALARASTLAAIDDQGLPARTLIFWAANDRSAPLKEVGLRLYEQVAAKTPDTQMHVFNRSGHYTYREHPAEFCRLVASFCLPHSG